MLVAKSRLCLVDRSRNPSESSLVIHPVPQYTLTQSDLARVGSRGAGPGAVPPPLELYGRGQALFSYIIAKIAYIFFEIHKNYLKS